MKSPTPSELSRWLVRWHIQPLRIALFYAIVSGIWIIASDSLVYHFVTDPKTANQVNVFKGWGFVIATAAMLWLLVRRLLVRIGMSESRLRLSEQQVRAVFNGVSEAIFIHDAESGEILEVNRAACRMFGHTSEEFRHLTVEHFSSGIPPYDQKNALIKIEAATKEDQNSYQWHCRHRDGHLFWTEVNATTATIGSHTRVVVTVRNIDLRKKATEQVRKLSQAVEQSPVSIIITDPEGIIEYVNPATCRLTGYTPEELIGRNPRILQSDDTPPAEYQRMWNTILQGGDWHGTFRNLKKNGEPYWEAASVSPIVDDAGNITHFLAVKENITERRKAEETLRNQEAMLEETGHIAHVGGWEFEPATGYASCTAEITRIFDFEPGLQPDVATCLVFFQDESRAMLESALAAAIDHGTPYDLILEMVSAAGHKKWIRAICRPVMEDGRVTRVRGTMQDITEHRRVEETLRNQEILLREAGKIAHVGGWEFDPVTGIGSYSPEVARIYDLMLESEVTKEDSMRFFHGESRAKIEAAVAAAIQHGTPYDLELEIVSATGRNKWVRTICHPIMENGRVVRVRGSIQDISDRKLADRELQESRAQLRALLARFHKSREEERTRLSREVHDVLGQLLTGMKMDISWVERRLPGIPNDGLRAEISGKLSETHSLTDSMLECIQKIARDLRPSLLDNLGLAAAIQSEARQFAHRTGISCEATHLPSNIQLPSDTSTQVFRIFQEVLTNVARHSAASKVYVALVTKPGELSLRVEDDGCGISPQVLQDPASLGLLGMSERAALIGGSIRFQGEPGSGTTVTLTIPHPTHTLAAK